MLLDWGGNWRRREGNGKKNLSLSFKSILAPSATFLSVSPPLSTLEMSGEELLGVFPL